MTRRRVGEPLAVFFARTVIVLPNGCWLWPRIDQDGYGYLSVRDGDTVTHLRVHRWSYSHFRAPIGDGLDIDHLCRNRPCVNPWHLDPCTRGENTLRSSETSAWRNSMKTHCDHGHPLSGENLQFDHLGNRQCRTCRLGIYRRSNARRRTQRKERKAA